MGCEKHRDQPEPWRHHMPLTDCSPFAMTMAADDGSGMEQRMITSTLEYLPGRNIKSHLGIVQGSTVRAKHIGRDIAAGLKNIVGGELKGYSELLTEARVGRPSSVWSSRPRPRAPTRCSTSASRPPRSTQGASEILAYGSAVVVGVDGRNAVSSPTSSGRICWHPAAAGAGLRLRPALPSTGITARSSNARTRFGDLIVVCSKTAARKHSHANAHPAWCMGNVVVSVDYFKRFVAHLRMIFGGRVHTYESLLDRGPARSHSCACRTKASKPWARP